ncbi:hypothetical protein CSV61_16335 [Sporosarcina sp. P3]|uniref:hypothetical protein n=1 Tax=Sporosarcina sp. P3 TaxID=2048245 RepID=UPI000C169467|nr:hypothetical protein [Sporosarcina sp. P3]PID20120.1 hypothetical protein CSV61_16335 [Sporosarcina sp. P3]
MKLPKISEIKFLKLMIHSFLVVFTLTLITLIGKDLLGWALGHPIEKDVRYVSTGLFMIWLLFALQKDKYKRENSDC